MNSTFQNSAQVLSIGIFFTLMIVGLSSSLPGAMYHGLVAEGVPPRRRPVAHLPPVSTLFAAFLGYNPMQHLLGNAVLAHLPAGHRAVLTGRGSSPASSRSRSAKGCTPPSTSPSWRAWWRRGRRGCGAESIVYVEPVSAPHRQRGGVPRPRGGPPVAGPRGRAAHDASTLEHGHAPHSGGADHGGGTENYCERRRHGWRRGAEPTLRIGQVAKICGVTTRTLRYWEEIGLVAPSEERHGTERVYAEPEVERAKRIRELQSLMGFSLAEISVVLETEESSTSSGTPTGPCPARAPTRLLADAVEANDKLVARLDDTLEHIEGSVTSA